MERTENTKKNWIWEVNSEQISYILHRQKLWKFLEIISLKIKIKYDRQNHAFFLRMPTFQFLEFVKMWLYLGKGCDSAVIILSVLR